MAVPEDFRQQARVRWARSARGWEERADQARIATMPVSAWLVDALEPQPGHVVLELAAGTGDTGFLAAELIQPGGTLICSDFVPEMLAAAQRRAQRLGIRNVRFKQIDAETAIDLAAASVDGVLCRWGYMLMADPQSALRQTRRVLRPGGRVALAAWTASEENPWMGSVVRELVDRGLLEPLDPDAPGPMKWAREGAIAEQLEAAGFADPVVDAVAFTYRYASVQDWWATHLDMSTRVQDAAAGMDAATEAAVLAALRERAQPFAAPEGSLEVPARTWMAAATA